MAVELRIAESEQDIALIFRAYKQMHDEGGVPGTFHQMKTMTNIVRLVRGPGACVLMAMDGDELAGVLSLYEEAYWWSEDSHIGDKGFYILPEYRQGDAFSVLMTAAKQASDDSGLPVFITIFNAKRRRGAHAEWERIGATLGYINQGAAIAHFPET